MSFDVAQYKQAFAEGAGFSADSFAYFVRGLPFILFIIGSILCLIHWTVNARDQKSPATYFAKRAFLLGVLFMSLIIVLFM